MNVIRSLEKIRYAKNSVVTVGTFDGVHRAHQEIVREVVNRAHMREGRSVGVTFDPHPKAVVASARCPVQLLNARGEDRIAEGVASGRSGDHSVHLRILAHQRRDVLSGLCEQAYR